MTTRILLLPGDGIGPEVTEQARRVLEATAARAGVALTLESALIGGAALDAHDTPLPEATLAHARGAQAVLLGAVGGPKWDARPPHARPEKGLLQIRKELGLFANLRPATVLPALADASTLRPEVVRGIDLLVVRELTGGIYFGEPRGREMRAGVRHARNTMAYDEREIERIARVAFEAALLRGRHLTHVHKANVLEVSALWVEVVDEVARDYAAVTVQHQLVDSCAMLLLAEPRRFDVILTGNLFGDILSDEAAMLTGSLGMLPSASLGAKGVGLYEPVHGSAPDIAGTRLREPARRHSFGGDAFRAQPRARRRRRLDSRRRQQRARRRLPHRRLAAERRNPPRAGLHRNGRTRARKTRRCKRLSATRRACESCVKVCKGRRRFARRKRRAVARACEF